MPLDALANAGVALSGASMAATFSSGLAWSVIAGLVVGKFVGISLASAIALRLLPATRLPGLDLPRIAGAAALSGMGFTISLLVAGIAIADPVALDQARIGVLVASLLALLIAWVVFRLGDRFSPLPTPAGQTLQRAVDPARDHLFGPPDAPATLVVYAAMDDDYRKDTVEALKDVRARLGDKLRVVFRHHTTTDEAMFAALALEAAAAQGRFREMHEALVRSPDPIDEDSVAAIAQNLGLDVERFSERLHRALDRNRVEDDNFDARAAELPTTPVLFAQGKRVTAAPSAGHLIEILSKAIADGPRS